MEKRNRRGRAESLTGKIFILVLFLVMVINFVTPVNEMSEEENRVLASKPELSLSSIISGDYMEAFESYMSDQFFGRNVWRSVKVTLSRLGGSHMENGVYIGKKGQLFEEVEVPDKEQLKENLTAVKNYSEAYPRVDVTMLLVPDSACVLSDRLPMLSTVPDQKQMINMVKNELGDSVIWVDTASVLEKHKEEKIYYKTDHHWTSLGAFYTFKDAAASVMGIEEDVSDKFVSYAVTDQFNGVLASKSGVGLGEKEDIHIYVPKSGDNDLIVDYVDEGKRRTSLFDSSMLNTRDKYAVFLGGNKSLIDIKTVSTSKKRLLVIKDSYANSFIQFLTPYYREIVIVDPRYYSGTIQEIMDSYRITDTLFLYSGNTFFTDNSISGVFSFE